MTDFERVPTFQVLVDWDNDGDFDGTLEDLTDYVLTRGNLTWAEGRDSVRSLAPPMISRAGYTLNNEGKEFSPEFPGSPIYSQQLPGRAAQIRATYGDPAITYNQADTAYNGPRLPYNGRAEQALWAGQVDDLEHYPERTRRDVVVQLISALIKLQKSTVSTALYESISTGTAFGHLLDAVGWPTDLRDIDTGDTVLLYWCANDEVPYEALAKLLRMEGLSAAWFIGPDGTMHFHSRNHRAIATASTTSQATFWDRELQAITYNYPGIQYNQVGVRYNGAEALQHVPPLKYSPPFRDVINVCRVTTVTRAVSALAVVWTYGTTVLIGASETVTITAKPSDIFTAAVCTNGVDVTASAGSIASVSLSRTSGGNTDISITAGAGGATVNLLRLRAQSIPVTATAVKTNLVDASDSIANFGERVYALDDLPDIDANAGQDLADAIVLYRQRGVVKVELTLVNKNSDHTFEQLYRRIGDRITVIEQHTGLASDFWIERKDHLVRSGGYDYRTTFGCEKVTVEAGDLFVWDDAAAVWDTAVFGV